jgi:ubiquinone/menaquinone biosynthesis C-methylase UbiE
MDAKPRYPRDAFAGTAGYYLRYRLPYPEALIRDLLARAGAPASGRLLDLGCGPGRATFPLAGSFAEAWAVDLEPEMIEAARREAAGRGVANIRWMVGMAEELEAPAGSFDLVTAADAFHRLDQPRIARLALRWLRPGGSVAVLGSRGLMRTGEPWQRVAAEVLRRYASLDPQAGLPPAPGGDPGVERTEAALREAGFAGVASHSFTGPHDWTAAELVGYLFSTSVCSRRALGGSADALAAELTAALLAHDPGGRYHEEAPFGYTLGRKPTQGPLLP